MNIYYCLMLVMLLFVFVQICVVVELMVLFELVYVYYGVEFVDLLVLESCQFVVVVLFLLFFLLGDEVRKCGYVLLLLFGVSINYMDMWQNINVDSINFIGLLLDGCNIDCGKDFVCKYVVNNIFVNGLVLLDNVFQIGVGYMWESSKIEMFKLDVWLLLFMNVYGLVGYIEGYLILQIVVGLKGLNGKVVFLLGMQDFDFCFDFKGIIYGMGIILVGGVGNWFIVLDVNYM